MTQGCTTSWEITRDVEAKNLWAYLKQYDADGKTK